MDHIDHLASLFDLKGKKVADIGAGKGHFSKQLAEREAEVTGIEIEAGKVAAAQARMPGGARILEGRGEALPLDDASQDLLCFIFSFHHIPIDVHDAAINEAVRVLKPGGHLHFVEPLAENCAHDPMKLIDDETYVRTRSHARINALAGEGHFRLVDTRQYNRSYSYESFDAFIDSIVGVDPDRAARVPAARAEMEQLFYDKAVMDSGRYRLDDPCRAYHFAS